MAGTGPPLTLQLLLWGDQCLKSKSPPHSMTESQEMLAALEKGQRAERGKDRGCGTCLQSLGPNQWPQTTVSWTAQGWGAEVGTSASSTPRVTSETQRDRQTEGKFT